MTIKLRHFVSSDDIALAHHADNPNVGLYLRERFPSPFTLLDARWWIDEGHCAPGNLNFAIDLDGTCIGSVGITYLPGADNSQAEIGYWIGEKFWGKGYTAIAITELVAYLRKNSDLSTIFAHVASPNIASMKALEKSGFTCTTINTKLAEVKAGVFDQYCYCLEIRK